MPDAEQMSDFGEMQTELPDGDNVKETGKESTRPLSIAVLGVSNNSPCPKTWRLCLLTQIKGLVLRHPLPRPWNVCGIAPTHKDELKELYLNKK